MLELTKAIIHRQLIERAWPLHCNPDLRYHNWAHINKMVDFYTKLWGTPHLEVAAAIAYHDVVYVPGSPANYNETMSMHTFLHVVKQEFGNYDLQGLLDTEFVCELIMATAFANHVDPNYKPKSYYISRVLDSDLAAFSDPYPTFLATQDAVLSEYAGRHVLIDPEKHRVARSHQAAFFSQFLVDERPYIYHTSEARERHEEAARSNLSRFIDEWSIE